MWRRGTTSTCRGAAGWMSLKATVVSVSCTMSEGTSPATIRRRGNRSLRPGTSAPLCVGADFTSTNLPGRVAA